MWRPQVARCLSIVGHPLVFLPLAVWTAIASGTSGGRVLPLALAFFALLALGVMSYSWLHVRSGRWGHVDASLPHERRSLNGLLLSALSVSALIMWFQPRARGLALGITLSCFLVGARCSRRGGSRPRCTWRSWSLLRRSCGKCRSGWWSRRWHLLWRWAGPGLSFAAIPSLKFWLAQDWVLSQDVPSGSWCCRFGPNRVIPGDGAP